MFQAAEVGIVLPNNTMNLTVRPVTRLACLQPTTDSNGHAQGARLSARKLLRALCGQR
jgi:hypothetical protein